MHRFVRGIALAVIMALFPATGAEAQNAGVPTVTIDQADAAAGVNAVRARYGLAPLSVDATLWGLAQAQADAMAAADQMSHDVAGTFSRRMPGGYGAAAENIAAGTWTLQDTLRLWEESPGHLRNMLIDNLAYVGFGYAFSPRSQRYYYALILAAPQ